MRVLGVLVQPLRQQPNLHDKLGNLDLLLGGYSVSLSKQPVALGKQPVALGDGGLKLSYAAGNRPFVRLGHIDLGSRSTAEVDRAAGSLRKEWGVNGYVDITTLQVPGAGLCEPYNTTLTAQDGSNNGYTWAIVAGTLPPGLTLQAAGTPDTVITGLAGRGSVGSYPITVEVTDSNGGTDMQALTIDVTDNGNGLGFAGILGDLVVDNRTDLFGVDLCSPLPTTAVRLNNSTSDLQDIFTGTDDIAVSPDGNKIAYIGEDTLDGSSQVYVVTLTNGVPSAPVRVSASAAWTGVNDAFGVRFSPDSNRLAFVADAISSVNEMFIVDTSGVIVADSAVTLNPVAPAAADVSTTFNSYQFSADSTRLVFVWDGGAVDNEFNLWAADVSVTTANSAVQVTSVPTNGDVQSSFVVPVPGVGARFIIGGDIFVDNDSEIGLVDVTTLPGTAVRANAPFGALSGLADAQIFTNDFGVSADGSYLWYFADSRVDAIIEPWVVDLTTPGTATQLATGVSGTFMSEGRNVPGGNGVLMLGDLAQDNKTELFIFDLAGVANQNVAAARVNGMLQVSGDVAGRFDYAVSPDGSWAAYTADQVTEGHDDAYVVPLNGLVPGTAVKVSPESTNTLLDATQIAFSTDGSRVAFEGDLTVSSQTEAYVSDLFGPAPTPLRPAVVPVVNGDVFDLIFASPSLLLVRGDVLVDNDNGAIAVDVTDPANMPTDIATQTLFGLTDVSRIILP